MMFKKRLYGLLFLFLLLVAPAGAQPACTVVASVFGKRICLEDINAEQSRIDTAKSFSQDEKKENEPDSAAALKQQRMENLRNIIWEEALHHKFSPQVLEPTDEEVSLYYSIFRKTLADNYQKHRETARKVENLLAGGEPDKEKERKLRELLQTLHTSISFYEEKESYSKNMPPEYQIMIADAEHDMAKSMLRKWKEDKALYEAYGGRALFQQGGFEPVEAYGRFIAWIRENGALSILDKDYEAVFAGTEAYIADALKEIPENENPPEGYFDMPFGTSRTP